MTAGPVLTTAIRYRAIVRAALLGALAWVTGCSSILVLDTSKESASILQPLQASSDVVTVDIYWATIPTDSTAEDEQLWRFVQEDRLDHTLRARLHQNGLRAGVVGGAPPAEIVRMLNPNGETTDTESSEFRSPLVAPTGVSRSTQQLRPGKAATIHASDILTEAPILLSESGQLRGEIYHDVQPVYSLKLERQESGGYNVVLTPELHHGQQRMRWSADETGMMTLGSATREKETRSSSSSEGTPS